MDDEINEEIRAIRRKLAAEQGNDLTKIMADLRARQANDGRVYVSFPKRPPQTTTLPPLSISDIADASKSHSQVD